MHSSVVRVQNVFGFFTSVAFAVAAAIAVSVLLSPQHPSASLAVKNIRVANGRPHYHSTKREEYAHVTFDLDADLSSLFNWNSKQLFVYITASYPSADPQNVPDSEIVVWDAIIPSDFAPFHPNTWIHPSSGKKPTRKERSRGLGGKAYPEGAQPGIIRLKDQKPKYQITDVSGKIADKQFATLTLHWNVQPWVGIPLWTNFHSFWRWQGLQGGISDVFHFPSLKTGGKVKKEDLATERGAEANRGKPA